MWRVPEAVDAASQQTAAARVAAKASFIASWAAHDAAADTHAVELGCADVLLAGCMTDERLLRIYKRRFLNMRFT